MKPVDEMWREFAWHHASPATEQRMEAWLKERYPEAEWTVKLFKTPAGGAAVIPKFKSKAEQTFYLLKWS